MLEINLPALRAEEALQDHGGSLTPEALREVMLEAGHSEDECDSAYCQRVLQTEHE